jgi:23S rRNA (adenine-N6)-dimethyltransferase
MATGRPGASRRPSGDSPSQVPQSSGQRRRSLSQNFVRDPRAVGTFLAALPDPDGHGVVEVGAGDGALTEALAGHFGTVTAWEVDPAMALRARHRLAGVPGVTIETGDFLRSPVPEHPFHLAGNVPFGITTPVINWCLAAETLRTATVITQWEYGRKRTGDYGRWSQTTVMSWPEFDWRLAGRIPRASFRPVPAVDAAVVSIRRRPRPLIPTSARDRWERDVRTGFLGTGGSLFASLATLYPRKALAAAFAQAGVGRDTVVAFVHPDAWVSIFTEVGRAGAQPRPKPHVSAR